MDTHMDLYVEHYMNLHNYINDKICNIGYSSELLLEEDSFITKAWNIAKASFNEMRKNLENVINFIKTIIFKWFKVVSLKDFEKISEENKKLNEKLAEQNNKIQKLKSVSDEKIKDLNKKIEEQTQNWKEWIKKQENTKIKTMVQKNKDKFLTEFLNFINNDTTLDTLIKLTQEAKNESESTASTSTYLLIIITKKNNKSNFEWIREIETYWSQLTFIKNAMLHEIKEILNEKHYNDLESLYDALNQLELDKLNSLFDDFPNNPEELLKEMMSNDNYIYEYYTKIKKIWNDFKSKIDNYNAGSEFIDYIKNNHSTLDSNSTPTPQLVKELFNQYLITESVEYFDEARKRKSKSQETTVKNLKDLGTIVQPTSSNITVTKDNAKDYIDKFNGLEKKFNDTYKKYMPKLKCTRDLIQELNKSEIVTLIKGKITELNEKLINDLKQ